MKIQLKTRKYWEIAQKSDIDELYPNRNRMVQAMKELLPPLSDYIKTKDTDHLFKKGTPLEEAFINFLNILNNIESAPEFNVKFVNNHYSVVCYYNIIPRGKIFHLPLDLMPKLLVKNKKLWTILIESINLIYSKGVRHLLEYDSCYMIEDMEESTKDQFLTQEERNEFKDTLDNYNKNQLNYKKIFNKRPINIAKLKKLISKFSPNCEAEEAIINVANKFIEAYEDPHDFGFYENESFNRYVEENDIDMEDEEDGPFPDGWPVLLEDIVGLAWFGEERYLDESVKMINDKAGNFGQLNFTFTDQCKKDGDINKFIKKKRDELGDFMTHVTAGITLFISSYDDIKNYCDNKLIGIL